MKITTTPFEASVYLDDKYKGLSPLLLKDIVAGVHNLKVKKRGYDSRQKKIVIKSNKAEEVRFTLSEFTITYGDKLTDIDGNVYKTVKIGDQWWMAENLEVTHYRNGDAIPNVTYNTEWSNLTTGAYCEYDNNVSNVETYGRLYNGYAVTDSRNIAPAGWHMPTDYEWKQLEMYLGMSQSEADDIGWRGTDEGGKLKESGTEHWVSPNTGATNESGFFALPGGYRSNYGTYSPLGTYAHFWSATVHGSSSAWYRGLDYSSSSGVGRGNSGKQGGFSVRCVRD